MISKVLEEESNIISKLLNHNTVCRTTLAMRGLFNTVKTDNLLYTYIWYMVPNMVSVDVLCSCYDCAIQIEILTPLQPALIEGF